MVEENIDASRLNHVHAGARLAFHENDLFRSVRPCVDNAGQDPEFAVVQITEDRDPPEYLLQPFVGLAEFEDVGPDSIGAHAEGMYCTYVRISISVDKVFDRGHRPALT